MRCRQITSLGFAVAALAGCRQLAGLDDPLDEDALACMGTGVVQICLAEPPAGELALTSQTINTDSSRLCADNVVTGGDDYCVIAATAITIDATATVTAVGSRPLVLAALGAISVAGTIDVATHRGALRGAGANFDGCDGGSSPSNDGGGAGGSFGGLGGDGGNGSSTAGFALGVPALLHGGCAGRDGGGYARARVPCSGPGALPSDDDCNVQVARRGDGGGAVAVLSGERIDVAGRINASGAGGDAGDPDFVGGGGGGGSGGMIALDAPAVAVLGRVFANGGGGSEGCDGNTQGKYGDDPQDGNPGGGGDGASTGGTGGAGGAGVVIDGGAGAATISGGGGGGSVGVIVIHGDRTGSGVVSPEPS